MPVKGYRVRYVVIKMKNDSEGRRRLIKLLRNICGMNQPGFHFKVVRVSEEVFIVRCTHKAIPLARVLLERLTDNRFSQKAEIIGISGTLRKAYSKFCRKADGKAG